MTIHIGAEKGEIAETVLMPGDPLRAKWAAETFLTDAVCVNKVRGMYGYTGTWNGHRVTIQGSGMGMPSLSIYANELIKDYDVQTLIRIGSTMMSVHSAEFAVPGMRSVPGSIDVAPMRPCIGARISV